MKLVHRRVEFLSLLLKRSGVTSVVVVHQPSFQIFEMFDDILIMSAQGFIFLFFHLEMRENCIQWKV